MNTLLAQLKAALGTDHVWAQGDPAHDLTPYEQDWRQRTRGRALAVVRPGNTAEVAAVVSACVAAGTPVVPQGGNTGLVVGGVPDTSGREVVLSLQRMNRVRALDPDNLTFELGG
jgi:FAD/FMN-containing dehydrogenase